MTPGDMGALVSQPLPADAATLAGHTVARVGFGAMQLGFAPVARDAAITLLRRAVHAGINHIDTAQFYGECNIYIHDALAPYPDTLVLVSKVGADRADDGSLVAAQRPEQLRAQIEANLRTLDIEQVAVVNLRRLDVAPGLIAEGDQQVDLDSQLAELAALRDAGKIGGIGLSNVSADQLRHALPVGIECVQNSNSLLDRAAQPVLDVCREHGIAWAPFCPLGSSQRKLPKPTDHPTVIAIARRLNATPAQVALAWLLAGYDRTLLIPGTSNARHLTDNIEAGRLRLPADAVTELDQITTAP